MFNIFNWIKERMHHMIPYKNISQALDIQPTVSQAMQEALELWESMYKDEPSWYDTSKGSYTMNTVSNICSTLAGAVTKEMDIKINLPGESEEDVDITKPVDISTRAGFLSEVCHKELMRDFKLKLEYGMAMGGMVIKPYISNGKVYFDFNAQGNFIPISFDDDGRITEIAFIDSITKGDSRYTKIEHHKFFHKEQKVEIKNTVYKKGANATDNSDLGTEVPISSVPEWESIEPEATVLNTDRPLYGYYRVPRNNNVDKYSPMGVSVFNAATKMIQRGDKQFSRLDWEYNGGELAIDVDVLALKPVKKDGKQVYEAPQEKERLFRKLDYGVEGEGSYNVFNPNLRDTNYKDGLNYYLNIIEDLCEMPKGSLCKDNMDTEYTNQLHLAINNQRVLRNITANQDALEMALKDVIYVVNLYATLNGLTPEGEYETLFTWDDSILTDKNTELTYKLQLVDAGILSKTEVRAWYTGESEKTAEAKIEEMEKKQQEMMLPDLFSKNPTLEA